MKISSLLLLSAPLLALALPTFQENPNNPSLARRDVDPADLAAFITAIFDGLANTIAATGGAAANTIAATGGAVANGLGGDTTTTTDTNATVAARSLGEDMGTTLGENVGKAIAEDLKRAVAGRLNGDA